MQELKKLFAKQWKELVHWFMYNVFLGTAFVWLAWLTWIYYKSPQFDFLGNIKNGNLLVFTISLCASSLGFYFEIARERMREMNRSVSLAFIVLLIVASYVYASSAAHRGRCGYKELNFIWLSASIFTIGALLSFYSYILRLAIQTGYDPRADEKQAIAKLSQEATAHDEAEGVKL